MSGDFFIRRNQLYQLHEKDATHVEDGLIMDIEKCPARTGQFGAGKLAVDPDFLACFGEPFPFVVGYESFFHVYKSANAKKPEAIEATGLYAATS